MNGKFIVSAEYVKILHPPTHRQKGSGSGDPTTLSVSRNKHPHPNRGLFELETQNSQVTLIAKGEKFDSRIFLEEND